MKNKRADDSWFFRFYEDRAGQRVHRNIRIGTVRDYPNRRDAEKAVLALRAKINSGVRSPDTMNELLAHYLQHELTLERKAFATVDAHKVYISTYVSPRWGNLRLSEVKTVAVEQWLESLPLAPASRTKIRNIMSAIFSHGIRHEWITFNPSARSAVLPRGCVNPTSSLPVSSNHL